MASPQAEDGHIDIANEIAEALYKINLSAYESRLLWFIFRKTYGWHKKEDRITFSQFEHTGIDRRNIRRTIKHLEQRSIITISGWGHALMYGFQKDYTRWDVVSTDNEYSQERQQLLSDMEGSLSKETTKTLSKQTPTKEKKETNKEKGRKQVSPPPEVNEQVKEIFTALKERRGWNSPNAFAEAVAIRWMLQQGFTPQEILGCHDELKAQLYWNDKPLKMMSVKGQIGEWRKSKQVQTPRKTEYRNL